MAVAYLIGGGVASGKTTLASALRKSFPDMTYVMPEDMDRTIPNFVLERDHEKSAHLTRELLAKLIREKKSIICDYAMAGECDMDFVALLFNQGYDIGLVFLDVPIEVAIQRAAIRDGNIPENAVRDFHVRAAKNFMFLKSFPYFTIIVLYDNTDYLKVIYHKQFGSIFINDQEKYAAYIEKSLLNSDGSGYHLFNTQNDVKDLEDMICGR